MSVAEAESKTVAQIFLRLERGQMDADEVALVTLVILAATCFMAGSSTSTRAVTSCRCPLSSVTGTIASPAEPTPIV